MKPINSYFESVAYNNYKVFHTVSSDIDDSIVNLSDFVDTCKQYKYINDIYFDILTADEDTVIIRVIPANLKNCDNFSDLSKLVDTYPDAEVCVKGFTDLNVHDHIEVKKVNLNNTNSTLDLLV